MRNFFKSFIHAYHGLLTALRTERNFQIHITIALVVIICGYFLGISKSEWFIVFLCITCIIAFELINKAMERLCDYVEPERRTEIKHIKDVMTAAVLIVAIFCFIMGVIFFTQTNQFILQHHDVYRWLSYIYR